MSDKTAPARCPRCDGGECPSLECLKPDAPEGKRTAVWMTIAHTAGYGAQSWCDGAPVDWRARCLKAEGALMEAYQADDEEAAYDVVSAFLAPAAPAAEGE